MPRHTIPLNGRTTRHTKFTQDEVEALLQKGFALPSTIPPATSSA